jgi:hypothetical protein
MAFIDPIKQLTTTIPLEYRPEDTMWVKVQFLESDGVTPFDMSSYNLQLAVYAPTVSTSLSNILNKIPDGTEQASLIVAVRKSRDNAGNPMFVNDNGIYLEDAVNSIYSIQYGKEEGVVFLLGEYKINLYARFEHGQRRTLVSFQVKFHNDVVDTGLTVKSGANFVLPISRTEISTINIVLPSAF